MVLYVIGLGLADERDITLKGLEAIKWSDHIYLEAYTSILMVPDYQARLEAQYGKPVSLATREVVELEAEGSIVAQAKQGNVSFLVVGDPLSATTHTDLILRARRAGVLVRVIHNASIMTALGSSGLQGYNFGQTISVPFWTEDWKPDSWLERIGENNAIGCHTLCLGDIKVREQAPEDMAAGRQVYQPPRYMLIPQLIKQLLGADQAHGNNHLPPSETLAIALCRMGHWGSDSTTASQPTHATISQEAGPLGQAAGAAASASTGGHDVAGEQIVAGTLQELLDLAAATPEQLEAEEALDDEEVPMASESELEARRAARDEQRALQAYGPPLHTLILVGKRLHPLEVDYAAQFAVPNSRWEQVANEIYGAKH